MRRDPDSFKIFLVVLLILVVVTLFLSPRYKSDQLQEKYDALEEENMLLESELQEERGKYYDLLDTLGSLEDDFATVYLYFENDNDITFEEASSGFSRINKKYDNIIYPSK